jgi:hypothetical protein
VGFGENSWFIPAGNTVRIISAQVGPNLITAVVDANTEQWPTLSPEIDDLVASLTMATA